MKDICLMSSDNICQCDLEREQWLKMDSTNAVTFPCEWRSKDSKCFEMTREYLLWRLMRVLTFQKEVL